MRYYHLMSKHPMYKAWTGMRQRCNNPKNTAYANYGARGIKVCERWNNFATFLADVGERPKGMTLDRKNPDGDYEPSNVRWATKAEQQRNQRINSKNTSGQPGVIWDKPRNKWKAYITVQNKIINIGRFDKVEDAIAARLEAEKEYWI